MVKNTFWKYLAVVSMLTCGTLQAIGAELVLVESDQVKVTSLDFEAALSRIPAEHREEFRASKKRISKLLEEILIYKTRAALARKAGIDGEQLIKKRLERAEEMILSLELEDRSVASLKIPNFELRALELYKINAKQYTLPEKVHASHILVDSKMRGADEALKRIQEARAKALAGQPFDALAQEYSDDPSAKSNKGDLGFFEAGKMVRPFSDAAFALSKPGEISEPVKTPFGYHIILFHEKQAGKLQPFDEVKAEIVNGLRDKFIANYRQLLAGEILSDPSIKLNEEAVDSLHVKLDFDNPTAAQKE